MGSLNTLAVPKGSTVLVIGANGLLGSHIADQFLDYGYNVRGAVRDLDKNSWLSTVFDKKYGKGVFELARVSDMASKGAFTEAVKDISIIVHSATDMSFGFDPHE
ncbi:aldehyde reductase, partial [Fusarium albosuccineum]